MSGYRSSTTPAAGPAVADYSPGYARVSMPEGREAWPVTAIPSADWPVTAVPAGSGPWQWPDPVAGRYDPVPEPPRSPRRLLRTLLLMAVLVIVAPLTGIAILVAIVQSGPLPQASTPAAGAAPPVAGLPGTAEPAVPSAAAFDAPAIAAALEPAVVDVNATLGLRNARAAGTGVILDSSGVILTNNHVIAGATAISVTEVGSGRTHQASVLGYDRSRDIAVLRLPNVSGLRNVALGDSSSVTVGDQILAMGNAGGDGGEPTTVTGTVTALNRSITATDADGGAAERLTGLIEVNADIQPGESGGPLVDRAGRLIGINTATSVDPGARAAGGQGYAIPVNTAIAIARQILSGVGSASVHIGQTALLGVQQVPPSGDQAGGQARTGAPVAGVLNGSPAQRAGLAAGDVIVSIDGRPVISGSALTAAIDSRRPGDRVRVQWVDRSGRTRTATVQLVIGPAG